MPDWFYRPVTRPVLFRVPAIAGRDFALGFMGRLARLPLGRRVIDLLGHMGPDPRLGCTVAGVDLPSRVALGPALDGAAIALPALSRFGFGLLDVGPVVVGPAPASRIERRLPDGLWTSAPARLDLSTALARLQEVGGGVGGGTVPVLVRLGYCGDGGPQAATDAVRTMVATLNDHVAFYGLATAPLDNPAASDDLEAWGEHVRAAVAISRASTPVRPLLLAVPADLRVSAWPLVDAAIAAGCAGVIVDGTVAASGGRLAGDPARESARSLVASLRGRLGDGPTIIAGGGVHDPADVLDLRAAGADVVELDSGIVFSGPGLPKRCNDALLFVATRAESPSRPIRPVEASWLWLLLMGVGMLVGSLMAMVIAATRTVLPYDEHFVGLSRSGLDAINPRLLAFMTHDRVTLAGTMIAIGVLYCGLSLFGIRRGLHWARRAVVISATVGFVSFFLFLGYGYLDPFHAFVTVVLLQLLLFGVHGRLDVHRPTTAPWLHENRAWRRATVGQLLMVLHAAGLVAAGAVIAAIGIGRVFVQTDLEFMATTQGHLHAASPYLVPLVAHDRATLGGMLLASGVGLLLSALWGYRNDSAWLWWTFLLAGVGAYGGVLVVHLAVGYTAFEHLAPVFAGIALYGAALWLSRAYLCARSEP